MSPEKFKQGAMHPEPPESGLIGSASAPEPPEAGGGQAREWTDDDENLSWMIIEAYPSATPETLLQLLKQELLKNEDSQELSPERIQRCIDHALECLLAQHREGIQKMKDFIQRLKISSSMVERVVRRRLLFYLENPRGTNETSIYEMASESVLSPEILHDPEVQTKAKDAIMILADEDNSSGALTIVRSIPISAEIIASPEIQERAEKMMANFLEGDTFETDWAKVIAKEFHIPEERQSVIVKNALIARVKQGYSVKAHKILQEFQVPNSIILEPEVRLAAEQGFRSQMKLEAQNITDCGARGIAKDFFLADDWVHGCVREQVEKEFTSGYVPSALELSKTFKLPDDQILPLYLEQFPASIQSKIKSFLDSWLKKVEPTKKEFLLQLCGLRSELKLKPWLIEELIDPTVKAQGIGAFRFLETYQGLSVSMALESPEDTQIIRDIVTTHGVRAIDTILFIKDGLREPPYIGDPGAGQFFGEDEEDEEFGVGFNHERFLTEPLSSNKHLPVFLNSFPAIPEIYIRFIHIQESGASVLERDHQTKELKAYVKEAQARIVKGECADQDVQDPTFQALVYHSFPPATTLDRQQYANLLFYRRDRQKDVPAAWEKLNADPLKSAVTISVGKYELKAGESLDTKAWNLIQEAVKKENGKQILKHKPEKLDPEKQIYFSHEDIVALGKRILDLLPDQKQLNRNQKTLLAEIYRLHRFRDGVTLTDDTSNRENLMHMKEYVGDRMKDIVDLVLKAYADADPAGYEAAVKKATTITIADKAKAGITKAMIDILGAVSLDEGVTNEKLKGILNRYGIKVEGNILDEALEAVKSIEGDVEVKAALEKFLRGILEGAAMQRQAGKLSVDIVQRLIGDEYKGMQNEMSKFEFIEGAEGGEIKKFRLEISKKRAHSVAGLNSGVCVAVDDHLWNKQGFSNVILWDEENIARGGMHFEVVKDGDHTYLSLPGINPSTSMLGAVDAEAFYDHLMNFTKAAAKAIGAKAILIPKQGEIHSNRDEIQRVIASKNYPLFTLKNPHQFSTGEFPYSWQDAYFVSI